MQVFLGTKRYKFPGLKSCLTLILTGAVSFILPNEVQAASEILLEPNSRGVADIQFTLEAQAPGSLTRILPLPFNLSSTHTISSPDDITVSILSNGNGYALLVILAPKWDQPIKFQINGAFRLIENRTQARTNFQFDFSYQNLTTHRAIFNQPETITDYDVVIFFQKNHPKDEISLNPPTEWQIILEGEKYFLPASRIRAQPLSTFEASIGFPNVYRQESNFVILSLSTIAGIIVSIVTKQILINPRQKSSVLKILVILALLYFLVLIPYLFRVRRLEVLMAMSGPTVTSLFVLFGSSWLLISRRYEAEIGGLVKRGNANGDPANYYFVELLVDDKLTKEMFLSRDKKGEYTFKVWCGNGKGKRMCKVQISEGEEKDSRQILANSNLLEVTARDKKEFDNIVI